MLARDDLELEVDIVDILDDLPVDVETDDDDLLLRLDADEAEVVLHRLVMEPVTVGRFNLLPISPTNNYNFSTMATINHESSPLPPR